MHNLRFLSKHSYRSNTILSLKYGLDWLNHSRLHDRTVISLQTLNLLNQSIWHSDSRSTNSCMILEVQEMTYSKTGSIQRSEHIKSEYRILGLNLFDYHTISKFEFEHTIALETTRELNENTKGRHTVPYGSPQTATAGGCAE